MKMKDLAVSKDTVAASIIRDVDTPTPDGEDAALRPQRLSDFAGQPHVKSNLAVFLDAAQKLGHALDHVLLFGPPGLGKTTLARIIANELNSGFKVVSAPAVARAGDLAAVLVSLSEGDVLFVDEIHRLHPSIEEMLYSAMEDFRLDLVVGEEGKGGAISIAIPRFTLVGATTRAGMLSTPLKDRFGIQLKLELYEVEDLEQVVQRAAALLGVEITAGAIREIARRSRGTPRISGRLLRRVRDFAVSEGTGQIDEVIADSALVRLGIDGDGLDELDRNYIATLANRFRGGPVGVDTLATAIGEARETLEVSVEPYLVRQGYVDRTPRGRTLSDSIRTALGL